MTRLPMNHADFDPKAVARLLAQVHALATEGCWLWPGITNGKYPTASLRLAGGGSRRIFVHRFVAALHRPLTSDEDAAHTCDVPLCVRPDHLRAASRSVNIQESWDRNPSRPRRTGIIAQKAAQTHCHRSHEFTPENTYITSRGTRVCRACHAETERQRRREAATRRARNV